MKHILLASASLVAFAGAAAAEITYSGSAELGYNDTVGGEYGFYWAGDLTLLASQELDNGLAATGSVTVALARDDQSEYDLSSENFVVGLTAGETGGLTFGNVEYAPISHWKSAGVMVADGFSEQDAEYVLRGDLNYGNIKASVSTPVLNSEMGQLGLGVTADFAAYNVSFGYQQALTQGFQDEAAALEASSNGADDYTPGGDDAEDLNVNEIVALSVGTTFSGAEVRLGYAANNTTDQDSVGITATYPVGAVALTGWVVSESGTLEGTSYGAKVGYKAANYHVNATLESRVGNNNGAADDVRWALEGGYDLGNGLQLFAGALHRDSWNTWAGEEALYVGAEYDLGKGAKVIASYADAENTSAGALGDDEVGARKYQDGTTVEVSFKF